MQRQYKGQFITLEGVEGVGKSTALQIAKAYLTEQGIDCVFTREPGGTPIAEAIRQVLLGDYSESMAADTELLLMFAGRAQHIAQVIKPALQKGQWVLSDRFVDASYAYQGGGREIPLARIDHLAQWTLGDLQPDITLLLDAPVAVGAARIQARGVKDRIEKENHDFFNRVRNMYLQLAHNDPQRFRIIDASQDLPTVRTAIIQILQTTVARSV